MREEIFVDLSPLDKEMLAARYLIDGNGYLKTKESMVYDHQY